MLRLGGSGVWGFLIWKRIQRKVNVCFKDISHTLIKRGSVVFSEGPFGSAFLKKESAFLN
jgi:hypothetical protein